MSLIQQRVGTALRPREEAELVQLCSLQRPGQAMSWSSSQDRSSLASHHHKPCTSLCCLSQQHLAPTSTTCSCGSMRPPRLQPGNTCTTLPLPPVAQKPELQLKHSTTSRLFFFFLCTNGVRTTEVPQLQLRSPWGKRQSLVNLDWHIKFNFILIL